MNDELLVEDIQLGDGKAVVKGALITTQYRGTLSDGTEFDSSYTRGKPFPVSYTHLRAHETPEHLV